MALSPNFGFPEPDNSSLVKNGAQDIRALGDSIDSFLSGSPTSTAGKNKIINGDFNIWQRGTTFNSIASSTYAADRWIFGTIGDVVNVTRQSFTPNDITAIGYGDAKYFLRMEVVSSNGSARMSQRIENVETLANQAIRVSFWAKANAAVSLDVYIQQNFGSGGSATPAETTQAVALTTSWQRVSLTYTVPSILGKTVGTSSYVELGLRETVASTNKIFDFFGVQVEAGSTLTNFQTASGGSPQAELALCQRYYYRTTAAVLAWGANYSATVSRTALYFPVEMRIAPTALEQSGTAGDYQVSQAGGGNITLSGVPLFSGTSSRFATINGVVTAGLTIFNPAYLGQVSSTAYLGWSAEL